MPSAGSEPNGRLPARAAKCARTLDRWGRPGPTHVPVAPASARLVDVASIVLFDLDNTLVDRQGAFVRWCASFVIERDLPVDALEALVQFDGDGFASREDVFSCLKEAYDMPDSVESLVDVYRSSYFDFFAPDEDALSHLRRLRRQHIRVGIVTNGPPTQLEKLKRTGLLDVIDGYCISDEIGVAKPNPEIFEEAVRRCGGISLSAGPAWMVGDTAEVDIAGGLNAGMRTIWIRRGRAWPIEEYAPELVADAIGEVADYVIARS